MPKAVINIRVKLIENTNGNKNTNYIYKKYLKTINNTGYLLCRTFYSSSF